MPRPTLALGSLALALALAACAPPEPPPAPPLTEADRAREANRARAAHLQTVIDAAGATADADTLAELGTMLVFPFDGVARDTVRGLALVQRAYGAGSGQAALALGMRAHAEDEPLAKRHYREAAARGELRAYEWLNTLYTDGRGPLQLDSSIVVLREAAAAGAPGADALLSSHLGEIDAHAEQGYAEAVAWRDTLRAKGLWALDQTAADQASTRTSTGSGPDAPPTAPTSGSRSRKG